MDSGATNYMIFDSNDFLCVIYPKCSMISNDNGVRYLVTWVETVILSSSPSSPNTLLISSLANKLLSELIIADLNFVAHLTFYFLQDILTKEIISHRTRKKGLYYINEFSQSKANQTKSTENTKEKEI